MSYRPSSARRPNPSGKSPPQQRLPSNREHASGPWQFAQTFRTDSPGSNGNGTSRDRTPAATANPSESSRYYPPRTSLNPSRARRSSTRETSPASSTAFEPRQYITDSTGPPMPAYRQSNHLYPTSDQYNSSPLNGYSTGGLKSSARRASRAGGTESTVSTTAPSTVWDELETLKSRINNLELTGKMPSSSGATNKNALMQRPATATTTITNLSSSPKHSRDKNDSSQASTVKGLAEKDTHPLLHSALERSRKVVSVDVFQALEATASDALTLAVMTSTGSSQEATDNASSANGTSNAIDRRLRRKADSLCRSLTELCIALSDANLQAEAAKAKSRPESRDTATNGPQNGAVTEDSRSTRAASLEPDPNRVSSRAMSRYEARRASIQPLNSSLSRRDSSPSEPAATPTQQHPQLMPTPRTSSVLLRRRTEEGERPLSRAMTEIGQPTNQRPSPHERISREYTSQHPLPNHHQRSPSVQSSLPQRKSYFNFTTPTYSPITPSIQPGSRRYLEKSTPPSNESLGLAQARQQRLASLGTNSGSSQQRLGLFSRRTRPVETGPHS